MDLDTINADLFPFAKLLGIVVTRADAQAVEATLTVRADLCTRGEILHGGAVMAFADSLGGLATLLTLPADGKGTATIESKTNFFRATAVGETLTARTEALHRGRTTHVLQTTLRNAAGKAVASVTQTQIILR